MIKRSMVNSYIHIDIYNLQVFREDEKNGEDNDVFSRHSNILKISK